MTLRLVSPVHGTRLVRGAAFLLAVWGFAALLGWPPAKQAAVRLVDFPIERRRAATGPTLQAFAHLAASQRGYPPNGPKAFTSPTPFSTFAIVDAASGTEVWRREGPGRVVVTDRLGTVTRVWIGDFTDLTTPGRYRIVADNGLTTHPFDIAPDVFDVAIRSTQRVFYYQRAFTAIVASHAEGPWTHDSDEHLAPPDVRHGWHDAGDFSLYNMTTVSSLFWLLEAYRDFSPADDHTNIPESGNGVPDLLDEIRWGLDWMLSVQSSNGGFRNSTCQSAYQPYGRNWPESVSPYIDGEVGTMGTARAVGVLAYASTVFAPVDERYARQLREAAARGWAHLEARPDEHSDGPTCDAYRQDGDARLGRSVRMFAAAGMLLATGERRFRDAFEASFEAIAADPSPYRFNVYACLLYLRSNAADSDRLSTIRLQLAAHADAVRLDARAHPFEWAGRYFWGSIAAGFERTGAFSIKQCLVDPASEGDHCRRALANLDYVFGRNVFQFAYVSGIPGTTRGRQHAFHQWLASLRATPYLFPGAVAGGPSEQPEPIDGSRPHGYPVAVWGYWGDPAMPRDATTAVDARYTDNDSWSTNELAITWQAVTLYNLYFGQWAAKSVSFTR